jgi:DNA-binding winged helix-turn-helix (wHTH) protein
MKPPAVIHFSPFRLDLVAGQLYRDDLPVPLRPKTWAMLCHLAGRPGELVTKDELLAAVWPDTAVTDDAPRVAVRELRRALGDDPAAPTLIETVHGRGWRFLGGTRTPPAAPFVEGIVVGRDAELATMDAWLEAAARGERVVGLVAGDAGAGKTTLVERFLARAAARRDAVVARAECREMLGAGEPYQPLLEAVSAVARGPFGDVVTAALRTHAPSWLAQMPSLMTPEEAGALRNQLAGSTGERMLREVATWVDAVAGARPLVLVVEDLHWSDGATLDALVALAHGRAPVHLLVMATYRPVDAIVADHPLRGVRQDLVRRRLCRTLTLGTLPAPAVQAYLAARFGIDEAAVGAFVHERSDGNPFFMTAVADQLVMAGCLTRSGEAWRVDPAVPLAEVGIPETLREMIERQLDALDSRTLAVLEAASVVGIEFTVAAMTAALDGGDDEALEDACDRLVRQGRLLRFAGEQEWPDGTVTARYAFRHALYRDVLYARLAPSRRARLHQLIGERLERGHAGDTASVSAELGGHFARSRDRVRAVQYLGQAAEVAQKRFADREAIACLERALGLLDDMPASPERTQQELMLRLLLGPSLTVAIGHRCPELADSNARIGALLQDLGETPGHLFAVLSLFSFELMRGRLAAATELADRACALAPQVAPAFVTIADMAAGIARCYGGAPVAGRRHLEAAAAAARPDAFPVSFDPTLVALSHLADRCLVYLGEPEAAVAMAERTIAHAVALGHPFSRAVATSTIARMWVVLRDPLRAATCADEALALCAEHGYPDIALRASIIRGWARAVGPDGADVVDDLLPLLASYGQRAGMVAITTAHLAVVEAAVAVGRLDDALHLVIEAARLVEETGERMEEAEVHRWRGEILLGLRGRQGRAEARACFDQAHAVATGQGARWLALRAATSRARLDGSRGGEGRARLAALVDGFAADAPWVDVRDAIAAAKPGR